MNNYCCKYCTRTYQRKVYYDRHIIACEMLSKPKKQRDLEVEELSDTPTVRKLYDLVLEMGKKMSDMEKRINEMDKWVKMRKQKVNIIEWLNQQYTPRLLFDEWIENIVITDEHVERLQITGLFETIVEIFRENISTNEDEIAVRGFDRGNHTLYTFTKEGWFKMPPSNIKKTMGGIYRKLLKAIVAWQKTNITECKNANIRENNEILYTIYIKKCMMAKISCEQLSQRMANSLHKLIKQNLKDVVQCEFTF